VDRFQGQQNDYILLSLVRTKAVGHLRYVEKYFCTVTKVYVFRIRKMFIICCTKFQLFQYIAELKFNAVY